MISNLPAIIVGNQSSLPVPKRDHDRISDESNRTRFVVDIPEPKVRGGFDNNLLSLNYEQAANQAGNFQLLLKEQELSQLANDNNGPISPYATATHAYQAAEYAATFARPTTNYLGSI